MTRIAWQVGLTRDSAGRMEEPEVLWKAIEDFGRMLAAPYEFELRFLDRTASRLMYPSMAALNLGPILADVVKANEEGVGAFISAPAIDPGVVEARGLTSTSMHVLGTLEAAVSLSTCYGNQVGIVAVHPGYRRQVALVVQRYGLHGRLIGSRPVRDFTIDYGPIRAALDGEPEALIELLESQALPLIEDGADVIVGAHQFLGVCLYPNGYTTVADTGVPFIDCAAAGIVNAKSLLDLTTFGLRPSQAEFSLYRQVPTEVSEKGLALYTSE